MLASPRASAGVAAAAATLALAMGAPAFAAPRDDTNALQALLDAGGTVSLPKLPNGACYRTRGLWLTRDDTRIVSDGACILALGRGEARLKTRRGIPIRATAVFFLSHSHFVDPLPARVEISGLHIVVPGATRMDGISVSGGEVTMDHVAIDGAPRRDVVIGGGRPGSTGIIERVAIRDSVLAGGKRDIVFASGSIGLRVERSTLSGARGARRTDVAAGLDLRVFDRGEPTLDVHVVRNRIVGNAGPGILLGLDPKNGAPVLASRLEIAGNTVERNARTAPRPRRAGIVLAGGQADGHGTLALTDNRIAANRGPAVLQRSLRLAVTAARNQLGGNTGGTIVGNRAAPVAAASSPDWLPPSATSGVARDDTRSLQARLDDAGGRLFLPRLPNGECYRTRGLWVSQDDTTITSDGACIVSLGSGDVRLHSVDGDPIAANGVFFVNRSRPTRPAPVRVTIENLRIVVPPGQSMYGVATFGHEITLRNLVVEGFPKDDVLIGGRANGNGYVSNVAVSGCTLSGAGRNAISAFGVIGLRIEGNTIEGVRDLPPGQPAAGIDVEPDDRAQPTLDVHILDNTIRDNAGPGILLELDSNSGPAFVATGLEVRGNTVFGNAHARTPPKRAGIIVAGGEDGSAGTLVLARNVVRNNGGPGVLALRLKLVVETSGNIVADNDGGDASGITLQP